MRKVYLKIPVIAALIFLFTVKANAQYNLGIATSNWSGINSLYLNPASIADCREKFTIELVSINMGVDNNLGSIGNKGGIIGSITNGNSDNLFSPSNSNKFSLLAPYAQVNGPGFMVSINHKYSIALTTDVRGMNQFNNFDRSLYETITNTNSVATGNVSITSNKFNYTAQLWSEAGLSFGGVVLDQGHNEIKVGATLRYLGGIAYLGLKGNNLDVKYTEGSDSIFASNSDLEYSSNVLSTNSAITSGLTNNSVLSEFFGGKAGSGIGGDIGVVYDYIQDPSRDKYDMDGKTGIVDYSKNRYTLRFSASIVDIGSILYNGNNNSNLEVTGNGYLTGTGLANNINNYNSFRNYIVGQGFTADTAHQSTRVYMPTRMILGADYDIYNRWYVNATFVASLANRQNFGNSFYNQITITPRYDTRMLSVGLPLTYSMLSKSFKAGIGVRVAGFFVGSDDMLALFANHQYGFNFYMGGFIPIDKFKPKDRDGDHVSNRRDKCPDEPGTWENRGCPVEDKDSGDNASDTTSNSK